MHLRPKSSLARLLQCSRKAGAVNLPRKILIELGAVARCCSHGVVTGLYIAAVASGFFTTPGIAVAQSAAKMYRIGWLGDGGPPSDPNRSIGEFQQGLRDAGYVEGRISRP